MKNYSIEVISFLIESIISVGTLLSSFPSFPPFGRVRVGAQKKENDQNHSLLSRGDRTRTCDSLVPNQERYQLRYTPLQ